MEPGSPPSLKNKIFLLHLFMMESIFKKSNHVQMHLFLNNCSLRKPIDTWNMNSWEAGKTHPKNQECMCMGVYVLSAGLSSA